MQRLHLTADLHHCRCVPQWLVNAALLGHACLQVIKASGLSPVQQPFHAFPATPLSAGGMTATVLLAKSHLCIHTWPELGAVTFDVYVCNFGAGHSAKVQALVNALLALFNPVHVTRHALQRGQALLTTSEKVAS